MGNYAPDGSGLETVKVAFENDPAPRVRGVALLALAVGAEAAYFHRCFEQALEANVETGMLSDYIAAAILNAAPRSDANWIDTATRRALALSNLGDRRRGQLEQLRSQYLPN